MSESRDPCQMIRRSFLLRILINFLKDATTESNSASTAILLDCVERLVPRCRPHFPELALPVAVREESWISQ